MALIDLLLVLVPVVFVAWLIVSFLQFVYFDVRAKCAEKLLNVAVQVETTQVQPEYVPSPLEMTDEEIDAEEAAYVPATDDSDTDFFAPVADLYIDLGEWWISKKTGKNYSRKSDLTRAYRKAIASLTDCLATSTSPH